MAILTMKLKHILEVLAFLLIVLGSQGDDFQPPGLVLLASSPFQMIVSPTTEDLPSIDLLLIEKSLATELFIWQANDIFIEEIEKYDDVEIVFQQIDYKSDLNTLNIRFFALGTTRYTVLSEEARVEKQSEINTIISAAFADQVFHEQLLNRVKASANPLSPLLKIESIVAFAVAASAINSVDPIDDKKKTNSLSKVDIVLIVVSAATFLGILFMIIQHVRDKGYFENQRRQAINTPAPSSDDSPNALFSTYLYGNTTPNILVQPKLESEAPSTPSTIESVLREEDIEFMVPAVTPPKRRIRMERVSEESFHTPPESEGAFSGLWIPSTVRRDEVVVEIPDDRRSIENIEHPFEQLNTVDPIYGDTLNSFDDGDNLLVENEHKDEDTFDSSTYVYEMESPGEKFSIEDGKDEGSFGSNPDVADEKYDNFFVEGNELVPSVAVRRIESDFSKASPHMTTDKDDIQPEEVSLKYQQSPTKGRHHGVKRSLYKQSAVVQNSPFTTDFIYQGMNGDFLHHPVDPLDVPETILTQFIQTPAVIDFTMRETESQLIEVPTEAEVRRKSVVDSQKEKESNINVSTNIADVTQNVGIACLDHPVASLSDYVTSKKLMKVHEPIIVETVTSMSSDEYLVNAQVSKQVESFDSGWFLEVVKNASETSKRTTNGVENDTNSSHSDNIDDPFGIDVEAAKSACDRSQVSNSSITDWMKTLQVARRTDEREIIYGDQQTPNIAPTFQALPQHELSSGVSSSDTSSSLISSASTDLASIDRLSLEQSMASSGLDGGSSLTTSSTHSGQSKKSQESRRTRESKIPVPKVLRQTKSFEV